MDSKEAWAVYEEVMSATGLGGQGGQLMNASLAELEGYYQSLVEAKKHIRLENFELLNYLKRLESLRQEIHSKRQHGETIDLGKQTLDVSRKTLNWARWAVVAAIVVPIVVALLLDRPLSNPRPAKASQASPTSSEQTIPNDVISTPPPAKEPPLGVPLESPTPSPTMFPPPAP